MLFIEQEVGGEWSVLLAEKPPTFVDVYSTWDPYPFEFWAAATCYFQSVQPVESALPGGRYACAQALSARDLPFLEGLSLGRICHFVQLAISHRKLLGYKNGALVPYVVSHSMVKDCCATEQAPLLAAKDAFFVPPRFSTGGGDAQHCLSAGRLPVATWEMARACVQDILKDAHFKGSASVPLSNMKRIFRTHCHCEFSETALGHTKLSELLQDVRMTDICRLQLQAHGYIVVPASVPAPPAQQPSGRSNASSPRSPAQAWLDGAAAWSAPRKPPVYSNQAPKLKTSVPDIHIGAGLPALTPHTLSNQGGVGRFVRNTFVHISSPFPTAEHRSRSVPKDLGSRKNDFEVACNVLSYLYPLAEQRSLWSHKRVNSTTSAERSTVCATDEHSQCASIPSDEDAESLGLESQCRSRISSHELEWYDVEACA